MVAVPQWSDQPMNARYIEDVWHVGVRARPDQQGGVVRREEMERCIREVMGSDKFLCNASVWKDKGQRAMAQGGSSDKNIKEFLRLLSSGSRKSSVS
jgi:UDP:flavonoid glycosyltransferase YjiC (YdhE family)